jgi:hypothetical protein
MFYAGSYPRKSVVPKHSESLQQYFQRTSSPMLWPQVLALLIEIIESWLHQCYGERLIHGNFHPRNIRRQDRGIQLQEDESLRYDFVLEQYENQKVCPEVAPEFCGYMPPELIDEGLRHPSIDCYAIGRIAIQLLTGHLPNKILADGDCWWQGLQLPDRLIRLICQMTHIEPDLRPRDLRVVLEELRQIDIMIPKNSGVKWLKILTPLALIGVAAWLYLPSVFYQQGLQADQGERYADAARLYRIAITLKPNHSDAHYKLGIFYDDLNQIHKAQEHYGKAGKQHFAAQNNLARLYIIDVKFKDAEEILQKIWQQEEEIESSVLKAAVHKNLSWLYFQQGRYSDAIKHAKIAIKLDDNTTAYCIYAKALDQQKQSKQALTQWNECDKRIDTSSLPEVKEWEKEAEKALSKSNRPI